MDKARFGMIGLGTMGRNFLLNVGEQGFSALGYDRDGEKLRLLAEERGSFEIDGVSSLAGLVAGLELPRRIMMLVPAGSIVDAVLEELLPHLTHGDIVIDGGNSHFPDTDRRSAALHEKGIRFLGVGVSGGEEGARHGASIMVGGNPAAYEDVREIFEAASAKVNGEACSAHVGNGAAGHFVKMVHNGIEYGMMQLICEAYDILRQGRTDAEVSAIFAEWNTGELNSFLAEITATVLAKMDSETGNSLVSMILDTAGQKGTGKWTSQVALDLGVPIPTIDAAVAMRQISARKAQRVRAAQKLSDNEPSSAAGADTNEIRDALYAAFLITYAQGMSLLSAASDEMAYELDLVEIAKIWRGGCIIRSKLLDHIRAAYMRDGKIENLLLDESFGALVSGNAGALRVVARSFVTSGIPGMCFGASLSYYDAFRAERLPANLLQAQRDFFGAHTYQRIDKEGTFHTENWDETVR